jgi:hypothetical protein
MVWAAQLSEFSGPRTLPTPQLVEYWVRIRHRPKPWHEHFLARDVPRGAYRWPTGRPGTGPGKHDPTVNGPTRVYVLNGSCLESPRVWLLAQTRPSVPLFVPGRPAWHGKKMGRASTKPVKVKKTQKTIENIDKYNK